MSKVRAAARRCIGNRFGTLYVESVSWEKGKGSTLGKYVNCICDCGNRKVIRADSLEAGNTSSCGCVMAKPVGVKFYSRKTSDHPMYSIFHSMQKRCKNINNTDYRHYGGRGVKVCPEWDTATDQHAFLNFVRDMEDTFEKGLEIERIEVNGDYEPKNCTWVCRRSQVNNLRDSRVLSGFGIELTVSEWGYLLNFNCKMLDDRINKGKDSRRLEDILADTFRDRRHTLIHKGVECNASQVWEMEGYTLGQRNSRLSKHGDSLAAFEAEGIEVTVVKPREKDYYTFEEGLGILRTKTRDSFEEHLMFKIEQQLKEKV